MAIFSPFKLLEYGFDSPTKSNPLLLNISPNQFSLTLSEGSPTHIIVHNRDFQRTENTPMALLLWKSRKFHSFIFYCLIIHQVAVKITNIWLSFIAFPPPPCTAVLFQKNYQKDIWNLAPIWVLQKLLANWAIGNLNSSTRLIMRSR